MIDSKPYNLNDRIRFKLTDKGRAYVAELNKTHPVYARCPLQFTADTDGWIEDELWQFANIFGPSFQMGFDPTVETTIQIRHT